MKKLRKIKLGNSCNHLLYNVLYKHLPFKNVKIKIYRTLILPVVLYWCVTLSQHRLRTSKNTVLKRIFRPKRGEITQDCRKLPTRNKELHNLYYLWCVQYVTSIGKMTTFLLGKPIGKRPRRSK
jgi:hypothetical protein